MATVGEQKCIMVILNRELQATPAVLRAAGLACKGGERLLLALFECSRSLARSALRKLQFQNFLQNRRNQLEKFANTLRSGSLHVDSKLYWGSPRLSCILSAVVSERPQMVFMDIQAEPLLHRLLFAPLDLDLLRQCPEPLMLVHPSPSVLPSHILAAVDPLDEHGRPHELNARILTMAKRLARQCKAQLDVVHVFEYVPFPTDPEVLSGWVPDVTLHQKLRHLHGDALGMLCKDHDIAPQHVHMLDGEPSRVISELATAQHSDVVIMGTVQRSAFERLAIGSVAERLLERLNCDVLTLKPEGFLARLQVELQNVQLEQA